MRLLKILCNAENVKSSSIRMLIAFLLQPDGNVSKFHSQKASFMARVAISKSLNKGTKKVYE